jgi:hypothetical protein
MDQSVQPGSGKETRYYHALGRACDYLLRCKDCKALVTAQRLAQLGSCECGNKRVAEIITLTEAEHAKIASGEIDFPYRAEFLNEFAGVGQ